jgi:hypothetical protein
MGEGGFPQNSGMHPWASNSEKSLLHLGAPDTDRCLVRNPYSQRPLHCLHSPHCVIAHAAVKKIYFSKKAFFMIEFCYLFYHLMTRVAMLLMLFLALELLLHIFVHYTAKKRKKLYV